MLSYHRPRTITELVSVALVDLQSEEPDLKNYLRRAERERKEGTRLADVGDLENAYIALAKAAKLILEEIPLLPSYQRVLTRQQKDNLTENGRQVLKQLEGIKPILVERQARWAEDQENAANSNPRSEQTQPTDPNQTHERPAVTFESSLDRGTVEDVETPMENYSSFAEGLRRMQLTKQGQSAVEGTTNFRFSAHSVFSQFTEYSNSIECDREWSRPVAESKGPNDHTQRYGPRILTASTLQAMSPHQMSQGYRSGLQYLQQAEDYPSNPYHVPSIPARPGPSPAAPSLSPGGLRRVVLPATIINHFLPLAQANTTRGLETCGLLLGRLIGPTEFKVTTLLVPKQHSTSDACTMNDQGSVMTFIEKKEVVILGWIHTHPSESCYMSSVDLHTHAGFQTALPESFAIVSAPGSEPDFGIFRLTSPGIQIIKDCDAKEAFHPHPDMPIYTDAGHVIMKELLSVEIVDLR